MAKKLAAALSTVALLTRLGITLTDDQKAQITAHEDKLVSAEDYTALETELSGVKEQLTTANTTIKSFGDAKPQDLKKQLDDWEKKYNEDTKALNDKLATQAYDHACENYLGGQKFASERVKKSVLADFKTQGFKLGDDGKLLGADDWLNKLKTDEPTTFAAEEQPQNSGLFMDKTHAVNPANQSLEAQIFEGFELPVPAATTTTK